MYQTETLLRRKLRVRYPAGRGQMVLRTELDWDRDVPPQSVSKDGETSTFALEAGKPFLYFKCGLKAGDSGERWSVGASFLLTMTTEDVADVFPHFDDPETGSFSPVIERDSAILGRKHLVRVYLPPGYHENTLRRVEIKPEIDRRIRVLTSPRETGVIGSSLGGVVSFFMAWEYPRVFGYAACMSSTFSHKEDLIDRVLAEPKHTSKFYLDSGWPGDNYEVTLAMAMALGHRGYRVREDLLHFVFPLEEHEERAWGRRLHLPVQLGLGTATTTQRRRAGA